MNRIPQNDPGFLAYQRKLRSQNKKKRMKRAAITVMTVLLLLSMLVGGVFLIWRAGEDPLPPVSNETNEKPVESPETSREPEEPTAPETPITDPATPDDPDDPSVEKIVVYIDAGHGFGNSYGVPDKGAGEGTLYNELTGKYESDMNLDIALKLKELLEKAGFAVIMIREGESTEHVTVNERVRRVNESNADIFVSIHANSSEVESVKGARVYYSALNNAAAKCEKYAKAMASALNKTEGASLKNVTVHTDRSDVAVIKGVKVPTVLVETCFVTNAEDAALAATEEWIETMASGICLGIQNYLEQVQTEK